MPRANFTARGRAVHYNRHVCAAPCTRACFGGDVVRQKRPFDANALLELKRIGDPQISPDGKTVAFTVQSVDLAANRKPQQVWTVPIEAARRARSRTAAITTPGRAGRPTASVSRISPTAPARPRSG